jgi:hypothetical protein
MLRLQDELNVFIMQPLAGITLTMVVVTGIQEEAARPGCPERCYGVVDAAASISSSRSVIQAAGCAANHSSAAKSASSAKWLNHLMSRSVAVVVPSCATWWRALNSDSDGVPMAPSKSAGQAIRRNAEQRQSFPFWVYWRTNSLNALSVGNPLM